MNSPPTYVYVLLHDRHHEMSGGPDAGYVLGVYASERSAAKALSLLNVACVSGHLSIVQMQLEP
jgi:hypothetical protein